MTSLTWRSGFPGLPSLPKAGLLAWRRPLIFTNKEVIYAAHYKIEPDPTRKYLVICWISSEGFYDDALRVEHLHELRKVRISPATWAAKGRGPTGPMEAATWSLWLQPWTILLNECPRRERRPK